VPLCSAPRHSAHCATRACAPRAAADAARLPAATPPPCVPTPTAASHFVRAPNALLYRALLTLAPVRLLFCIACRYASTSPFSTTYAPCLIPSLPVRPSTYHHRSAVNACRLCATTPARMYVWTDGCERHTLPHLPCSSPLCVRTAALPPLHCNTLGRWVPTAACHLNQWRRTGGAGQAGGRHCYSPNFHAAPPPTMDWDMTHDTFFGMWHEHLCCGTLVDAAQLLPMPSHFPRR